MMKRLTAVFLAVLVLSSCARSRRAETPEPAYAKPLLSAFVISGDPGSMSDDKRVTLEAAAVKIVSRGSAMVAPILSDIRINADADRRMALVKLLRMINDRAADDSNAIAASSLLIDQAGQALMKSERPGDRRTGAVLLALPAKSQLVPAALALLDDPDSGNRRFAGGVLREVAGIELGYNPDAPASDRAPAVKRWRDWWARNESRAFYYMPNSNPVLAALTVEANNIAAKAGPYELLVKDPSGAPLADVVVMYSYRFTTFDGKGTSIEHRLATSSDGRVLLGIERAVPGMRFIGAQVILSKAGFTEQLLSISPHLLTPNSFTSPVTLAPRKP